MRVNIYAQEITQHVERRSEKIGSQTFTGVRFYLELPSSFIEGRPATKADTVQATQMQAPFIHRPGDDDSSAVTFWATDREELRAVLRKALSALDD